MGQSKRASLIEACLSTASGFLVSLVVWHFVARAYGIPMPLGTNLQITAIFTVVSVARSYVWRRGFNWLHLRARARAAPALSHWRDM